VFFADVEELNCLRSRALVKAFGKLRPGHDPLAGSGSDLLEIRAKFAPGFALVLALEVRGLAAPAPLARGKQRLIVFADRTGLEVFASHSPNFVPLAIDLDPRAIGLEARISADRSGSIPSKLTS
jgi:fructan beta-fructosidase